MLVDTAFQYDIISKTKESKEKVGKEGKDKIEE